MWCVPALDAAYVERMQDVLAVYEKPYDPSEPVVCFDEKPVCLHQDKRTGSSVAPGKPAKRDYEYKRCGTANVFCAVEPLAGRHFIWATPNRSAQQFACVMQRLANAYPLARTIHLVLDNLNIHNSKSLIKHLGEQVGNAVWNRFTVHHTPKHASWLNQAEIEISLFSRQCLGTRRIGSFTELRTESGAWKRSVNKQRLRINWSFSRRDAENVFHKQIQLFKQSKH